MQIVCNLRFIYLGVIYYIYIQWNVLYHWFWVWAYNICTLPTSTFHTYSWWIGWIQASWPALFAIGARRPLGFIAFYTAIWVPIFFPHIQLISVTQYATKSYLNTYLIWPTFVRKFYILTLKIILCRYFKTERVSDIMQSCIQIWYKNEF